MSNAFQHRLELARQGNPDAIASLINRSLQPRGITVSAHRQGDCLDLVFESSRSLAQATIVALVQRGIAHLEVRTIRTLTLHGRKQGITEDSWAHELKLVEERDAAAAVPSLEPPEALAQSPESALQDRFSTTATVERPSTLPSALVKPDSAEVVLATPALEQVAIADKVLYLTEYGLQVQVAPFDRELHRKPIIAYPTPIAIPLGRQSWIDDTTLTLLAMSPAATAGDAGIGKTLLLQSLLHHTPLTHNFADGAVYVSGMAQTYPDLLHHLFKTCFEYDSVIPVVPTDDEVQRALRGIQMLVLLDDPQLTSEQLRCLSDDFPGLTVLLASRDRTIADGQANVLKGLDVDDALALLEQGLGRPLPLGERPTAREICLFLNGHPLRVLQAATLLREHIFSPSDLAEQLKSQSIDSLMLQFAAQQSDAVQHVLSVLALLDGMPIAAEHLSRLQPAVDDSVLATLERHGLIITVPNGHYQLASNLVLPIQQTWPLDSSRKLLCRYFNSWVLQHNHDAVQQQAPLLLWVTQLAVDSAHWQQVRSLVYYLERALIIGGQWSKWEQLLQLSVRGAESVGDQASLAWIKHQQGVRLMCLGQLESARACLESALELREMLGDEASAALTQHNLQLLQDLDIAPASLVLATPPDPEAESAGLVGVAFWSLVAFGSVLGLSGVVALALTWFHLFPKATQSLALSDDEIDFGDRPVQSDGEAQTIVLTNMSAANVIIERVGASGTDAIDFDITQDCTKNPLKPDDECAIEVEFVPTGEGDRTAQIKIETSQDNFAPTIALRGTGVAPESDAILGLTPRTLDFANQPVGNPSSTQTIDLHNRGDQPLQIDRVSLAGQNASEFSATTECVQTVLQPDAHCSINVSFKPTGASQRNATLEIAGHPVGDEAPNSSDATNQRQWTIALQGVGLPFAPVAKVEPIRTRPMPTTATPAPAPQAASPQPAPTAAPPPAAQPSPAPVPVQRAPVPSPSPTPAPAAAAPLPTRAQLSTTALNFGEQAIDGEKIPQAVVLSNSGNEPIRVGEIAIVGQPSAGFTIIDSTCRGSLVPGDRCLVAVRFSPTQTGQQTAQLSVTSGTDTAPQRVLLQGIGVNAIAPQIVEFRADPPTIAAGQSTNLCYQIEHASRASIYGVGSVPVGSNCISVRPQFDAVYTLVAQDNNGRQVTQQLTVTVAAPATPAPAPSSSEPPAPQPSAPEPPAPESPPPLEPTSSEQSDVNDQSLSEATVAPRRVTTPSSTRCESVATGQIMVGNGRRVSARAADLINPQTDSTIGACAAAP